MVQDNKGTDFNAFMKRQAFIFLALFFCVMISSQVRSQQVPPFKMTLSNNKIFNAAELPKGKPLVLIYFDPDCDHCKKLMTGLFKNINSFKKTEIVLITFKPVADLISFEKIYSTNKHPNIKVGTEGRAFYLKNYYNLVKMPFTVLYDKKGNYNYSYKDEPPFADLLNRVKAL